MYCGMPKGTSWDKIMSNSEKIKPIILAVIELCLPEGIGKAGGWAGGQVGGQSVENSINFNKFFYKKFIGSL